MSLSVLNCSFFLLVQTLVLEKNQRINDHPLLLENLNKAITLGFRANGEHFVADKDLPFLVCNEMLSYSTRLPWSIQVYTVSISLIGLQISNWSNWLAKYTLSACGNPTTKKKSAWWSKGSSLCRNKHFLIYVRYPPDVELSLIPRVH